MAHHSRYQHALWHVTRALAQLPKDAKRIDVIRAERAAYPFGERKWWPYKAWLRARRVALYFYFPRLFPQYRNHFAYHRRRSRHDPRQLKLFEEVRQ